MPGTSPRISTAECPQPSPPLASKQKKVSVPDSPESSPPLALKLIPKQEKKEHRKHKKSRDSKDSSNGSHNSDNETDQLMRELALAKIQCAEASGQVEQKKMVLRQALQRGTCREKTTLCQAVHCHSRGEGKLREVFHDVLL